MLTRFAQRLRILRRAMQYSMDRFVALYNAKYETKMTKYALARYEKGLQLPSHAVLLNLADFFNVTVDYLTGRDASVPTANTPETNTPSLSEPPITPQHTPFSASLTDSFVLIGTYLPGFSRAKSTPYSYTLNGDGRTTTLTRNEYNALKSVLDALRSNRL